MSRVTKSRSSKSTANFGFEAKLWLAADKLRKNMDAADRSDTFEEYRFKLVAGQDDYEGTNPEDPDGYKAEIVFLVPQDAHWSHLQATAKQPTIGELVDDAMVAIKRDKPRLKGALLKDCARPGLGKQHLGNPSALARKPSLPLL
jgi:type I restriction enzyme M protein